MKRMGRRRVERVRRGRGMNEAGQEEDKVEDVLGSSSEEGREKKKEGDEEDGEEEEQGREGGKGAPNLDTWRVVGN